MLWGLEKAILADMGSAKEDKSEVKDLMYCGHFFHHAPSDAGLLNLIQEVNSAYGDRQKVLDICKLFHQHTLCVCEFVMSIGCCSIGRLQINTDWKGRGTNQNQGFKPR